MSLTRTLAVAGTFILAATPAFAANFVEGSVATNAHAFFGAGNTNGGDVQSHRIITAGPTTDLSAIQSVAEAGVHADGVDVTFVTATSDATASWESANKGSFRSITHRVITPPPPIDNGIFAQADFGDRQLSQAPSFAYQFTAGAADNLLKLGFDIGLSGDNGPDAPGMGAFTIDLKEIIQGGPSVDVKFQTIDGEISGDFTSALLAGHTYELQIRNIEGLLLPDTTFHNIDSGDNALFNWEITNDGGNGGGGAGAVPEPASWALMLGGFGLVGGAMRASRRKTAVAFN